jgi:hypothetical protein
MFDVVSQFFQDNRPERGYGNRKSNSNTDDPAVGEKCA